MSIIDDLLNKLKKPAQQTTTSQPQQKVTGVAGAGSAGARPTATPSIFTTDVTKQKEALAKKTNQDIVNAAYKVADQLKLKGGPWPLLRSAGWGRLTEKRGDLYKGPFIDDIEALTPEVKEALKKTLGL
jgi:hypothetical protein